MMAVPCPYGGYRLGGGLRLPPLVFSSGEALGLVKAVLDGQHSAADAGEPVGAALGKIIRALPRDVAKPALGRSQYADQRSEENERQQQGEGPPPAGSPTARRRQPANRRPVPAPGRRRRH